MKTPTFIHEDFLLENRAGRRLFHEYAEALPIVDYHSHLPSREIAEDRRFKNLTQVWLDGDHYKWRLMRACGVPERFCTGDASDWEKFEKWAETVPKLLRNPVYHWTHMELKHPFGITRHLLNPGTARRIWEECNEKLACHEFTARSLMKQFGVALVCTTDDPVDDLEAHRQIAVDSSFNIQVRPTWRPDKALAIEDASLLNGWIGELEKASGLEVGDFDSYLVALKKRQDFFGERGCLMSDHGLEEIQVEDAAESEVRRIFEKARSGRNLDPLEARQFRSALLHELAVMDFEKGWAQQFHLGALRGNNSRMLREAGPDKGFDSIGDLSMAKPLSRFLDRLDSEKKLARTILYNLNPRDNELFAAMTGNFQDGSFPGKMQYGSAWWFLDQRDGILRQLEALSNMGVLGLFVGMLTDSRSFLSYTRHDYFRRIFCNLLGDEMERGLIPSDFGLAGELVKDVCYRNAVKFFGFPLPLEGKPSVVKKTKRNSTTKVTKTTK